MLYLLVWLPLQAACSKTVEEQVADPHVGDVYVVRFQPPGSPAPRYYFYHLFRVAPDSVYLHPARQDSPTPDANLRQLAFEPTPRTIAYTRAELRELLLPQPGDVTRSQLIQVRRP